MATTNIHAEALSEVEDEIRELEKRLAEAKAAASYHASRLGTQRQSLVAPERLVGPLAAQPPANRHSGEFATTRQVDAAAKVLSDSDHPLKTAEIVKALIDRGFPQRDAKKLTTSLFTSLMRKPDMFEKAGAGLWKLKNMKM